MQRIGQLIRLHTNEVGFCDVDRFIHFSFTHIGKGIAGVFSDFGHHKRDKCLASAHDVFKKARDTLVHGTGHIVGAVIGIDFCRLILHKQCMTAFVQGGIHIGNIAVFIEMGGDAHILCPVVVGKRVLGGHQHRRGGV